jgi:glycosyltransferase involved in cell wall biosynthesis
MGSRLDHLRYWRGVLKYRLTHPDAYRELWEKLNESLDVTRLHGMRLGAYRQHGPRPPCREAFPARDQKVEAGLSFAIVTPSFNQRAFVGQTIASVLGQDYPRLQYAVIDGGSQDGSQEEIEKHASRLSTYLSEPDAGQSDAIAKGFSRVTGEVMAYLNSDDLLMPGVLAYVSDYFEAHPEVDVIYGHRIIVDEVGQQIGRWVLPPHSDRDTEFFDFIPQETMFWRRRIWEKAGGIDPKFHFAMDWDLILRFIKAGAKFVRVPYYLAYFRAHDSQKSQVVFGTRGQAEIDSLLAGVHEGGVDRDEFRIRHRWYRRKAVACAVLLDMGIRV